MLLEVAGVLVGERAVGKCGEVEKMKAFVSCLSTDNYLNGILVLYQSLMDTNTKYPFYCLVSDQVSEETRNSLEKVGVHVIVREAVSVSGITNRPMEGWDYTYFKFRLFELTEFEKLVYLDADMIVMRNIDALFDEKAIAICQDGYQFTGIKGKENCGCNSGLMVIEPDAELFHKLVAELPAAMERGLSGDQEVLNLFLDGNTWLPAYYNMTPNMIDKACYREKYFDFRYKDIRVVHFIWKMKPFFTTKLDAKRVFSMLSRLHFYEVKVNRYYYKEMKKIMRRLEA